MTGSSFTARPNNGILHFKGELQLTYSFPTTTRILQPDVNRDSTPNEMLPQPK